MKMCIEEILRGRQVGRLQSVGQMQVIPILGESDNAFAPPRLEIGTTEYGRVRVDNVEARTTIVPPGSAWVVRQGQDHAVPAGSLVPAASTRSLPGVCVQEAQPGLIPVASYDLQILPVGLRATALELRNEGDFTRLWPALRSFKASYALTGRGNLVDFLRTFRRELDTFVAEFEIVEDQIGAIVLIGGAVAGLELTPSTAYWEVVWEPLIRLCYGSLALHAAREGAPVPATRVPLVVRERTVQGIARALAEAQEAEAEVVATAVTSLAAREVRSVSGGDTTDGSTRMRVVRGRKLIGQVVHDAVSTPPVKFASLVAHR